jgi:glycosyltransferase involved in cell wall biosynthesis
MARLSVLIPAYNEAATIGQVLDAVAAVDLAPLGLEREIIVADDGSTDETAAIVRRRDGVVLVSSEVNRGKGCALRGAIARATGEWILIQDADLEYDPRDYPRLLAPLCERRARVVFGSRFLARGWPRNMRPANFVANKLLTLASNVLYHSRITDEATCYKVFDAALLRSLPLRCESFDFCPEVVALLGRRGEPILEVPVRYSARTTAEGKKVGWRDALAALRVLVTYRIS